MIATLSPLKCSFIAAILCAVLSTFILLVYLQTLEQSDRKLASWPVMLATIAGTTIVTARLTSTLPPAIVLIVGACCWLIACFFVRDSLAPFFVAWTITAGMVIGKGLFLLAIPLTVVLSCVVIYLTEHRQYV